MAGHQKWRDIKRKRDGMISKPLQWARARGLNCEQDIMAETLRQSCATNRRLAGIWFTLLVIAFMLVK